MLRLTLPLLLVATSLSAAAQMQRVGPQVQPLEPPTLAAPPAAQRPTSPIPSPAPAGAGASAQARPTTPLPPPVPMPMSRVEEAVDMVAPLNAAEVLQLRRELADRARAATQPIAPTGKPSTRLATMDLSPGAMPQVVRISREEGVVINFLDAAGRPWPIASADSFNSRGFDISAAGENGLSIAAKMDVATGNVAVRLQGMPSVISFKVLAGHPSTRDLDYVVDMQIPRYIPGAPIPVGAAESRPSLGAADLMNYLMRTPPREARELKVDGLDDALAWQTPSGQVILRTNKMVLAPSWTRRQSTTSGTTVYEIAPTPVVLVSDDGVMRNVRISGFSVTSAGVASTRTQEGRAN